VLTNFDYNRQLYNTFIPPSHESPPVSPLAHLSLWGCCYKLLAPCGFWHCTLVAVAFVRVRSF